MTILIGSILFIVFFSLAVIHIYWGLGGKLGVNGAIPTNKNKEKVISPGLFECSIVASVLFGFGIFILIKIQIILFRLPGWLLSYGLVVIAALFLVRSIGEFKYVGFFKKVKTTKFAEMDTKYYSPLCLLISVAAIILELIS
jgi:hypothetical protein